MKGTHKVALAFAAAVVVVGVAAFVAMSSLREIDDASEAREYTSNLIIRANDLMADVSTAEAGQRAYAMTADPKFLPPYSALIGAIQHKLKALSLLAGGRPSAAHEAAMARLVDEKLVQM